VPGPGRESGQVAVRAGDRRVGVLTAADSEDFGPTLDHEGEPSRPEVTEAELGRTSDDSWHLTVCRPTSG
jgi:hypothetical protein